MHSYELKKPVTTGIDVGLRAYLTSIYNWLTIGLLVTAGASFFAVTSGLVATLAHGGILFWAVALLPFALIFFMGGKNRTKGSTGSMAIAYVIFALCQGLSLSVIVSHYTGASVATAFAATAAGFLGCSLYSYTTKRDLTGMGAFFLVALIGLLVAMVLSAIFHSSVLTLLVSAVGVVIFAGLIAYDTQVMRADYVPGDTEGNAQSAIWHALGLLLDFINLFLFLLRFVGVSNDD